MLNLAKFTKFAKFVYSNEAKKLTYSYKKTAEKLYKYN